MPQDAPPNGSAPGLGPQGPWSRVAEMQAKLHRWAAADPGRRFDDLFNFVHDPATLIVAFGRVAGNRGANTPGIDGLSLFFNLPGWGLGVLRSLCWVIPACHLGWVRPSRDHVFSPKDHDHHEGRDGQLARGCARGASRRAGAVPAGVPCLPDRSQR
jgi:hypothetical protein